MDLYLSHWRISARKSAGGSSNGSFFHDVLNTAGGVQGLVELLKEQNDPEEAEELIDMIWSGAHMLIEEINAPEAIERSRKRGSNGRTGDGSDR